MILILILIFIDIGIYIDWLLHQDYTQCSTVFYLSIGRIVSLLSTFSLHLLAKTVMTDNEFIRRQKPGVKMKRDREVRKYAFLGALKTFILLPTLYI